MYTAATAMEYENCQQ